MAEKKKNERLERFQSGMETAAGMVELNLLFVLTSLPVFTIGASFTALHVTIIRQLQDRGGSLSGMYLKKFRDNFKQSTLIWLIAMALYAVFVTDYIFAGRIAGKNAALALRTLAMVGIIIVTFVTIYGLILTGLFENSLRNMLVNSLYMSFKNAPRSFAMSLITLSPVIAIFIDSGRWSIYLAFYVILWVSAAALFNIKMIRRPLQPYLPDEDTGKQ